MAAAPDLKKLQQSLQPPPPAPPAPTAGPFQDAFEFIRQQINPDPGLLDRMAELQRPEPPAPQPQPDPRQQAIKYASDQFIAGLSSGEESLQPLSPYYDEPRLQERLNSVIYTARQLTGGVLRPEVAWDLARSGLDMNQVTGVIRYMLEQAKAPGVPTLPHRVDGAPPMGQNWDEYPYADPMEDVPQHNADMLFWQRERERLRLKQNWRDGILPDWGGGNRTPGTYLAGPYLSDAEVKAHMLAPTAGELPEFQSKVHRDEEMDLTQQYFPQVANAQSPAAATPAGGIVPAMIDLRNLWSWADQVKTEAGNDAAPLLSWLANNAGEAWKWSMDSHTGNGDLIITNGGQQGNPSLLPGLMGAPPELKIIPKGSFVEQMGDQGPVVGKPMADPIGATPTNAELLHGMAIYFDDSSIEQRKGTYDAQTIQQLQEYMNAKGNAYYQLQLAAQGYAGDLKPNGVINPDTEVGKKWIQAVKDFLNAQDAQLQAATKTPGDAPTDRDVPVLAWIHALQKGDSAHADSILQHELLPKIGDGMSIFRLLQWPFAPFEWAGQALPETINLTAEVSRDPRYAPLIQQAITEGKLVPPDKMQPGTHPDDWQWAEANIHDQAIVNQIHQIALDKLQVFGLGGDPTLNSFGVKHLGSLTELIGNMVPYKPMSDTMVEWSHDHPVAESLISSALMLAAPVPKVGTLVKVGVGDERYFSWFSRAPGGINPYLTSKFAPMIKGGQEPEPVFVGRMISSGRVQGHFRGLTEDQESRLGIQSPEEAARVRSRALFGPANEVWIDTKTKGVGQFLNDLARSEVPHYQVGPATAPTSFIHGERTPEQIAEDTVAQGGTSYQPTYQLTPKVGAPGGGYMVGVDRARSVSVPKAVFGPQHIEDFEKKNADLFKDPRQGYGTWLNPETGNYDIDISRHTYNKNEAHALGVQHEQQAIYDLAADASRNVSRALANKVRAGRGHPAGSGGVEGGGAAGEVRDLSAGPGRAGAAGEAGPAHAGTGLSTVRVRAQTLRELNALRAVVDRARVAGRDLKLTVNGQPATEVPLPAHIPTRGEISAMLHSVLAETDRALPGEVAVRPGLYARLNNAVLLHGNDPHYGWLLRSLAQKAYNGTLNYRDPSMIDKVISVTSNYVRDPAMRRKINEEFRTAYREGAKGSTRFYNAKNLLHDAIDRHYTTPEAKAAKERPPFEAKGGWSAGVDAETGRPRTESIYDNAKKHEAYMASLERAVRKPAVSEGSAAAAAAKLDSPGRLTLENLSWALNTAVRYTVRVPATIFSAGLQNKVYLMAFRKVLAGEIPGGLKMVGRLEDRVLGPKTKTIMKDAELGRLRYTFQQDFAGNAPAHFADYNSLDSALEVGLGRVFSSSIYGVNKRVRTQKLSDAMSPEETAQLEASYRMTVQSAHQRLQDLELQEIPTGPAFHSMRDEKAALHRAINRASLGRDAIKANRLPPDVAEPLVEQAYREWLQSPGGIDYQKASFSNADGTVSGGIPTGELWTSEKIDRHVSAAMQQVNGQFVNYPKVHDAFLAGEKDRAALLKIASRHGELADRGSKASSDFWFSHDVPSEKSFLANLGSSAWAVANRTSYYAFKRTKLAAFDRFTEANLEKLWPEVEAGRMTSFDAGFFAMQHAHDQTYESLFNLQLSMTNAEQRLRFMAPFATKVRLYFTDLVRTLITNPKVGAALNNVVTNFRQINPESDKYNQYRVSSVAPFTVPGLWAKGDRIDYHLDNAFWLGPNHDLINAAVPGYIQDTFGLGAYDSVFGYDGSQRNPYASFFPRVGQEVDYIRALAIANGKWPGVSDDKHIEAALDSLPSVERNYINKRVNAFIYLHALKGEDVNIDDAVRAALMEELHFSTLKVTTPFNIGVVSADQVEVEQQLKAMRAVRSHDDLAALEQQYPQISELFHLTENPQTFKQFVMGQAGYLVIKNQYQDSIQHIESTWGPAALIVGASGWKEAGQEYADANRVRNEAIANLAKTYPAWGAFRGFVYQDAKGNWVSKDEGMSIIRQREALLKTVHKQWQEFQDDNMILPGSAQDRERIATTVNNYDDLIGLLQERDKIKNPTPDQKAVTKELGKVLFQFQQDFGDILDTYRPQATGDTTLRDVKKSYFDNVYTPFFNAQTPIFKRLDDPLITSKEKGVLLDQLRNLKDRMNLSYADPNFPGVKLPPPEQHQFAAWDPVVQAQHVATWRFYAAHKPEWLTDWQTQFLQDPSMLAEAVKGWDSEATKAYLDTLTTLQAKEDAFQSGRRGGGFSFSAPLSAGEQWRLNLKNRGLSGPNIIAGHVPAGPVMAQGNIIAANAPAVFPRSKSGKLKH